MRQDQPGIIGIKRLFWRPYEPTDQELQEEMNKLEKEIAKTKEASSKNIIKILQK